MERFIPRVRSLPRSGELLENKPRGFLSGTLLGVAFGGPAKFLANAHFDAERLGVLGSAFLDDGVLRQRQLQRAGHVLQGALIVGYSFYFGVEQGDVSQTIQTLFGGVSIGYSHRGEDRNPIEIAVKLPKRDKNWTEALASTPVPANTVPGSKTVVELGQVVKATLEEGSPVIFRRDGRFADMVTAELAGRFEAPLYGMMAVADRIDAHDWGKLPKPVIAFHGQPADESHPTLLWDGEWEITYVTFRDMGAAFGVAILGIYFLVVAQFGSFKLPLVILTPIPLTLIGILIGHWLLGAPFTATSMIGFIALAGIIVRNSILLVDFIRHSGGEGKSLRDVVLEAGAVRFKPILLTALAAMIGAATILLDPIFQGLAISLLFGLASSTLLTVLVIPAIYIALRAPRQSSAKLK